MRRLFGAIFFAISFLLPILTAVGSSAAQSSEAQSSEPTTRVVFFKLEGPMGSRMRDRIVASASDHASLYVVQLPDVLDATGLRPAAGPSEIAQAKNLVDLVDVAVIGETRKRGRRWQLSVTYLDSKDGSELGKDDWSARRFSGLNVAAREIPERLAGLRPPTAATENEEGSEAWWDKEGGEETLDDDVDEDAEDAPPSEWSWLSVAGHIGALRRDLEAVATVVNNGRNPSAPANATFQERRSYSSKGLGHMEVGILAEVYPGMFLDDPIPWIGVRARLMYGLFLSTTGCQDRSDLTMPCMEAQQFELDSSQYELYLGARGRYRFDEVENLTLFADLGWGHFSFGFAEEDLRQLERVSVVPSFGYHYLRASVSGEYQAIPKLLAISAELGAHLGLGIGQQAKEVWGVESSGGSGWLLAIRANSEVADNVLLGVAFEYMTFSSSFEGQTACIEGDCASNAIDTVWEPWPSQGGDPNAVVGGIADSVTDHYVRLAISIGTRL